MEKISTAFLVEKAYKINLDLALFSKTLFVCLCWGFTAQSTQLGHVERDQFT